MVSVCKPPLQLVLISVSNTKKKHICHIIHDTYIFAKVELKWDICLTQTKE